MTDDSVLSLIEDVYSAAQQPDRWPVFLENLSTALGSKMSVLMHQDAQNRQASVGSAVRIDPTSIDLYQRYYATRNVFFTAATAPLVTGRLMSDSDIDDRTLLRSEYYGDYLQPRDVRHAAGFIVFNEAGVLSVLSTMRSQSKGAFSEKNIALLRILRPHVQRALQLHRALCSAEERASMHAGALDVLNVGIILIDERSRITFVNRRAATLTREADGLKIGDDELTAAASGTQRRLRELIADALRTTCAPGRGSAGAMLVERPSGKQSYQLTVSPLQWRFGEHETLRHAAVAIIIRDPEWMPAADDPSFQILFGLSPAESRVAACLLRGARIPEVAASLGIGIETVRTHLKRIFGKTGTRRQADLVALLTRCSPVSAQ